jgi:hypothetical protein
MGRLVTARRELDEYVKALRARVGPATAGQLHELRARYDAAAREHDATPSYQSTGGMSVFRSPLPSWELLEAEFVPSEAAAPPRKPAHRPPRGLPVDIVARLEAKLEHRRTDPSVSQQAIADHLGVDRHVVQDAEALTKVGWPLPRSDPEFGAAGANDGRVYWPTTAKALQTMAEERSGASPD